MWSMKVTAARIQKEITSGVAIRSNVGVGLGGFIVPSVAVRFGERSSGKTGGPTSQTMTSRARGKTSMILPSGPTGINGSPSAISVISTV